jgi:hypothetical protein
MLGVYNAALASINIFRLELRECRAQQKSSDND